MTLPKLGELAVDAGLLEEAQRDTLLELQTKRAQRGEFLRFGELLVAHKHCDAATVRTLLALQAVQIVACGPCQTRFNGLDLRGGRGCLRCGRALTRSRPQDPLAVEDSVCEATPAGRALRREHALRSRARCGPYAVLGEIGRGGMGTIYKAWATDAEQMVVLKFLRDPSGLEREDLARFRREAGALMRLDHPTIVRCHGLIEEPQRLFLVLDFLPGVSLDLVAQRQPLTESAVTALGAQVAGGLAYIHRAGLVHRDVKLENIVVDRALRPKLVDFGVAKDSAESMSLTMEDEVVGSLVYLPPEYLLHGCEVVPSLDVYGLGVVLYELLSGGALPYGVCDDDRAWILRVVKSQPVPLNQAAPECSRGLAAIVDRAIAKDPAQRYATAEALATELERCARGG